MYLQDGEIFRLLLLCGAFYYQEDADDIRILVNALVGFLSFETILHCLGAFFEGHKVYFFLVLVVLLRALDVSINIFSKLNLGNILVDICSHVWYWDDRVFLTLYRNPDIPMIGSLAPSITRQGLVGSSELVGWGSCHHILYVTLQFLG